MIRGIPKVMEILQNRLKTLPNLPRWGDLFAVCRPCGTHKRPAI